MSLVKTLARVAAGVILAKGIGTIMRNAQNGTAEAAPSGPSTGPSSGASRRSTGGGILGDLLNRGTGARSGGGGGLGDILGQVLGGTASPDPTSGGAGTGRRYGGPQSGGAQGGLGGLFDKITSGRGQPYGDTFGRNPPPSPAQDSAAPQPTGPTASGSAGGGLGGILAGAVSGGLGGLLGGLLSGRGPTASPMDGLAHKDSQPHNEASFGEVLNDAIATGNEPQIPPTPEQNAVAGLLLRAMIQAAKSDGQIDDREMQRLVAETGEQDGPERDFIREQMAAPVDPIALARETPQGLGPQVYLVSLMAIDFDNEAEARYLHALAEALGLAQEQVNAIHQQVGVQNLYS
ncbi:tellurite resistance TerB family protein [Paracoccus aminophilus]|uniref:Tellurite resistance TerB family protein n=1 Tax=Paracoccus aminophilus JCM 7686 TaxID=1367847 RepID=S5YFK3_PARAH|nr:tellurite resistance TerB family protein [Paracoccus aminophilus]AGT10268.1 hypothetical protein JCM7686_3233 [Paracoccus aminophilus JCM 7686]